jgi:hypothetical protein
MKQSIDLQLFLLIVIGVLIIFNIMYSKSSESFVDNVEPINSGIPAQNSSVISWDNSGYGNNSDTIVLDPNSNDTVNTQMNNNFKEVVNNKEDIEANNKLINDEITKTIIEQEIEAEELLSQEEVFGKDSIDNEIPLKKPTNLLEDSQNFKSMFQKLDDAEYLCNNIERRQKLKNNLEQMKINEMALKELDKQDTQISELKNVLKALRIEEARRNRITTTCNNNSQKKLNSNYNTVKTMVSKGILPKKNTKINFNLPKINLGNNSMLGSLNKLSKNTSNNDKNPLTKSNNYDASCMKCSNIDTTKMIHKDKLKNSVCVGCDKKILDNKDIIKAF